MKTTQKKQAPKETTPSTPAINDFFTQFLEKRQKHFVKKLEKINELEKKKSNELTTEQQELVQNKHLTHERIKYFDDIKDLYAQAHVKKEVPVCKNAETDNAKSTSNVSSSVLNLFFTGNVLHHLTNTSQQAIESTLTKEQQNQVSGLHAKVFSHSHTHNSLEEAKTHLTNALNDCNLMTALNNTVNSRILEKHDHSHEAHHHEKAQPAHHEAPQAQVQTQAPSKNLFHHSSEDEEEEEQVHAHKNQKANERVVTAVEVQQEFKIVALPEDNEEGEEKWVTVGGGNRRGRGQRGTRGQRGGRGPRQNQGEDQNEGEQKPRHYKAREDNDVENADNEKEGRENQEGDQEGEKREHRGGRGFRRGRGRGRYGHNGEQGRTEEGAEKNGEGQPQEFFARSNRYNNRAEGQDDQKEGNERGYRGRGGRGYRGRGQGEGNFRGNNEGYRGRGEYRGQGEGFKKRPFNRNQEQSPQEANQ